MADKKKMTILDIQKKKEKGTPLTMLTAYDYPSARLVEEAGTDIILIGDSLAMTILGHNDTVRVTMDEMLHHCKAVKRGAERAFLVGDMPFMSYQVDKQEAVRNSARFLKEAEMDAVKLEGGREVIDTIKAIIDAGIAVMGHVGLTPQSATKLGGFRVQGRTANDARRIFEDAQKLERAGCFAIVLEAIPEPVAREISKKLTVPTIGIGAGAGCDGQVLVFHDILGLYSKFAPRFVKKYADLEKPIVAALSNYCQDVETGKFPGPEHSFQMSESELALFMEAINGSKQDWI